MIPAFVVGVLIGGIIAAAIAAWHNARTIASPEPSGSISATGLGSGRGGIWLDPYSARLMRPILERMAKEL
jgi:hypothetical protein